MNVQTPRSVPRATYQDVLDAPENKVAELIGGVLYMRARPAPMHVVVSSSLGDELVSPFQKGRGGPGGWWILDEPELHLGHDVLVPDLAGWQRTRMPSLPETAWFDIAPDWVCEILSPSTRRVDLFAKRPVYAEHGIRHLWLIDPVARIFEAFELREGDWVLVATLADEAEVALAPFEAVPFSLADLWGDETGTA